MFTGLLDVHHAALCVSCRPPACHTCVAWPLVLSYVLACCADKMEPVGHLRLAFVLAATRLWCPSSRPLMSPTHAMQVQVSGRYPNDTANILNSTTVCNSYMHVIDSLLLPTASLATIPAPGKGLNLSAAAGAAGAALLPLTSAHLGIIPACCGGWLALAHRKCVPRPLHTRRETTGEV